MASTTTATHFHELEGPTGFRLPHRRADSRPSSACAVGYGGKLTASNRLQLVAKKCQTRPVLVADQTQDAQRSLQTAQAEQSSPERYIRRQPDGCAGSGCPGGSKSAADLRAQVA
jgi:hypothetical protein